MRGILTLDEAAFIPTPVDDLWCDLCQEQPYTGISADGAKACTDCMLKVLDGVAEAAGAVLIGPNREQRRRAKKAAQRKNNGQYKAVR